MLDISPDNVNSVSIGEYVNLTCSALGGPNNVYQWFMNEEELENSTDTLLQLGSVNATSGGTYTCLVSNVAGNDSISTPLYIEPSITMNAMDIFTMAGERQTLTFTVEAFPKPEYQWIRISTEIRQEVTGGNSSVLLFDPAC